MLGLAPNAARLSVRFFWQGHFGTLARNLTRHYQRLDIVRPAFDKFPTPASLAAGAGDRPPPGAGCPPPPTPNPRLAGDLLLAVLNDTLYPATLLDGVTLRIRAERNVSRGQAAILKAYYMKYLEVYPADTPMKEALNVKLNEQTTYLPYVLGRLFSVLEAVQRAANPGPGINTTIRDRYFNSASATPATVFPLLINLAQKHLAKLDRGLATFYDKKITTLMGCIDQTLPTRMTPAGAEHLPARLLL